MTSLGQLAVEAVALVERRDISAADALAAGFPTLQALLETLDGTKLGEVYRVRLTFLGPDPRVALREELPDDAEIESIFAQLASFDSRQFEVAGRVRSCA